MNAPTATDQHEPRSDLVLGAPRRFALWLAARLILTATAPGGETTITVDRTQVGPR
jgi:hypothetical protein